jgi:phenylpropionate dioxygenase-like ring-hydroxylating dioxygenase large terminal subunit
VRDGQLQCLYHGWRFNGLGQCTQIPGRPTEGSRGSLVSSFQARESQGLIWIKLAGEAAASAPTASNVQTSDADALFLTDRVRCSLAEAAENFLDGFHTHFVHEGWIRHDTQRQTIEATVHSLADGVEAIYRGEELQSGFLSRWLEGERGISMGRFRFPGLAEIEYRNRAGQLNLLVSAWLTPEDDRHLRMHARVLTRRTWIPAWAKKLILGRLFRVILRQDKEILEATAENAAAFEKNGVKSEPLSTVNDLLAPSIRKLLNGEIIPHFERNETIHL